MKSHRKYVADEIERSDTFAEEYTRATEASGFALALVRRRESLGLTQRELSERAGLRQPMLARIERGQMPRVTTLERLAEALHSTFTIRPGSGITLEPMDPEHGGFHAET